MSDEFDRLKDALRAAPPAPDAARRAENIAAALKNFDAAQEKAAQPRLPSNRPENRAGLMEGLRTMFNKISANAALIGSTSVAALVVGFYLVQGQDPGLVTEPPHPELAIPDPVESPVIDGTIATGTPAPEAQVGRVNTPFPTAQELAASPDAVPPISDEERANATTLNTEVTVGYNDLVEGEEDLRLDQFAATEVAPPPPAPAANDRSRSQVVGGVVAQAAPSASEQMAPMPVDTVAATPPENTEEFANAEQNPVKVTVESPVSTFSADVDTASWAIARSSLMSGYLPGPDSVRIEEMVNYFPYDYAAPDAGEGPFRPSIAVMQTPWNPDTQLVRIALQGEMPSLEDRPPLNLVFLIDTSGSMQGADKLGLLRQSLKLMLAELRPEDQVAIVAYAGSAGQVLAPTPAGERATIIAALDRLEAGGSTAGQAGLQQAYAIASAMMEEGEVARVLLATDGDFNVGISDPDALKDYIATQRDTGVYLSVLGFGRGNLDDATMQALAQNGNGQAAYIDTLVEAQKVLVDQLTGALFTIAGDVKLQVEWNPAEVAEYRLIGYETRALAREDFNNDRVDAGELGAGHSVTALYEITPPGSPALLNDPLRYAAATPVEGNGELGFLRLRYKAPGDDTSQLIEVPILQNDGAAAPDADAQFAAAIAGFGQLLRDPKYLGDWGIEDAIALATAGRGTDEFGYRAEAIRMMRLAGSLLAR